MRTLLILLFCLAISCGDDVTPDDASTVDARADDVALEDTPGSDTATRADAGPADANPGDANPGDGGPPEPPKAFPGAYGGGAGASGGRGGVLIIVNTPNPAEAIIHFPATATTPERYEGGLYAALQHDEPAYIVFDRSMNIRLGVGGTGGAFSSRGIPNVRDKTIFGQSAPRGGITITGGTFRFDGRTAATSNLIFRYFRSRPILNRDGAISDEDDAYTWGLLFFGGHDIIVDHCSFSFASDKALGGFIDQNSVPEHDMRRITFSGNMISDSHTGYYVEINPDRPEDPEDYVDQISFLSNLSVGINRTPNVAFNGYAEVVNNVIYGNHSKSTTMYHDIQLNVVGNYYFRPDGRTDVGFNRIFQYDDSNPRVYATGNFFGGLLEGTPGENNQPIFKPGGNYDETISGEFFVDEAFDGALPHPYAGTSAADAYASVVTDGDIGAHRYLDDEGRPQTYRDPYDEGQLETVREERAPDVHNVANWVLPEIPTSTRPETYDTDFDGMADAWEVRVLGDLSQDYNGDHDNDGYTNIEEFMNQEGAP